MLSRNLAKQTNNFEEIEDNLAFAIWLVEKEFNVGPIDDEFPLLKLNTLLEKKYHEKYERMTNPKGTQPKTFR